jgi:predicted neutral ceramidase superfamily lipid hydrolase
MGFSAQKYRKERHERRWKIHPIWRGIGCALILLIPIMAWFGASLILQTYRRIPLSYELTKPITLRYVQVMEIDAIIANFNRYAVAHNLIVGQFLLTIILMFLGFGLLSVVYAIMFRAVGPSRYGPFDVPPNVMRK